jgi:pimeloyl-ACP methyl ester carboxylesterase
MAEFNTGEVQANGLRFHYLEMGEGPLALCLHGFPDSPYSYRYLLPELAEAGYRAVAPFNRGLRQQSSRLNATMFIAVPWSPMRSLYTKHLAPTPTPCSSPTIGER